MSNFGSKESPTTTATIFVPYLYLLIYIKSTISLRDENVKGRLRKEAKCQKSGQTAHVWIIIMTTTIETTNNTTNYIYNTKKYIVNNILVKLKKKSKNLK